VVENQVYVVGHSPKVVGSLDKVMGHCLKLGLDVSLTHVGKIHTTYEAMAKSASDRVMADQFTRDIASLVAIIHSELAGKQFRYIESIKTQYCALDWLASSKIFSQFPRAFNELRSAGRCYAYGESTACAFHLNRALEDGLKALAVALGQSFHKNSWDAHLKDVERELERRYKAAGARTADEHFYSDLSTQFGHMKTAWRNPTMHIESQYDDKGALYLLQTTERFFESLCERGLQQGDLV
jgi:hypothetical protein